MNDSGRLRPHTPGFTSPFGLIFLPWEEFTLPLPVLQWLKRDAKILIEQTQIHSSKRIDIFEALKEWFKFDLREEKLEPSIILTMTVRTLARQHSRIRYNCDSTVHTRNYVQCTYYSHRDIIMELPISDKFFLNLFFQQKNILENNVCPCVEKQPSVTE